MKKQFPLPLVIDCAGLSRKLIRELANSLTNHFRSVEVLGEEITAADPIDLGHYHTAWLILDRFGVKVT